MNENTDGGSDEFPRILLQKVSRRIKGLSALKLDAEKEIVNLNGLQEKIEEALRFIETTSKVVILQLVESHENWKKYPQLKYIYEMNGLF